MVIPKQVVFDLAKADLLKSIKTICNTNKLTLSEMELVIYQVLADIKTEKEVQYSDLIIELANHAAKLEDEKKQWMQGQSMQLEETKEEK